MLDLHLICYTVFCQRIMHVGVKSCCTSERFCSISDSLRRFWQYQVNLYVYIFIHKQGGLETIHSGTPLNSPSHVFPLPRYPLLHVHVYEPGVFVQRALASQGDVPEVHSLISVSSLK